MTAKTGSDGEIVYNYSGQVIANDARTFALAPTIPRLGDLGLGGQDGTSYVDAYGALAEMFVYEVEILRFFTHITISFSYFFKDLLLFMVFFFVLACLIISNSSGS